VPPFTVRFSDPSLPPKQFTFCEVLMVDDNAADGCVIDPVADEIHPLASVMDTV
jgi:hypothetical protein